MVDRSRQGGPQRWIGRTLKLESERWPKPRSVEILEVAEEDLVIKLRGDPPSFAAASAENDVLMILGQPPDHLPPPSARLKAAKWPPAVAYAPLTECGSRLRQVWRIPRFRQDASGNSVRCRALEA